jgi:O-antigen/teichoic acid export membrane protein
MSAPVMEARAAKATLAAGLSMGLSIALQLLSVPVCLRFWGEETYGLWLALLALATIVRTLDFGFTAYVGNELNLQYHRDLPQLRRTLSSALMGAWALIAVELLAGALIIASGSLANLLGLPEEVAQHGRAGLVFAILLFGFVVTGPLFGVVHKLLIPAGMLHQSTWWFMGLQITQTGSLVVSAFLGFSLVEAAALFSVSLALIQAASALYVARKLPQLLPWWKHPSRPQAFRDLARSTLMSGALLLTQAGTNGVVMVISAGLGAAVVPLFTTVRTLTSLWTTLTNVLTAPLLPDVVRYHAQSEPKKLLALLEGHWLLSNGLVNLSILVSFPFLDFAYRTWTRGLVELDPRLLAVMLLAIVVGTPGSLVVVYLTGINDLRAVSVLYAVRGLVPLAVGFSLLGPLGLVGLGIGIALGELLGPVVVGAGYLRQALRRTGSDAVPRWQPMALGTASAAGFLALQVAHGPSLGVVYITSLFGVLSSLAWGWAVTSPEVRVRVLRLIRLRSVRSL